MFPILGFAGLLLGMFAIGVMQLILAVALPLIVTEIGGGELYSWVFSSYMLASIAVIPLCSKLADIYGKRRFYLPGMILFALGSLYGGFAPTMPHLILARVLQGLGAGIIAPVALAMVSDGFPPEKRGNMIGMFGFIQLLANLLSPLLGSLITQYLGWSWIFFLNLGLIIVSFFLVSLEKTVQESRLATRLKDIDILGGLVFGGFSLLAVGLSNTVSAQGKLGWAGTGLLLTLFLTALILIRIERKHENPVIKMEFLSMKILRRSLVSALLTGAIMYGLVTVFPLLGTVLSQQGFKLDESSTLLLFMLSLISGLLISSRIGKLRTGKAPKVLWLMLTCCSLLLVSAVSAAWLIPLLIVSMLTGLCTGGIMATFLINSQNAVSSEDRTVLSGLVQLFRYFGASVGVTLLTGMLPEVTSISTIEDFIGAFGLVVALSILGILNEIL